MDFRIALLILQLKLVSDDQPGELIKKVSLILPTALLPAVSPIRRTDCC